jgi:hypothetical protein
MKKPNVSERYIMPEPGEEVTMTFSDGLTQTCQFNGFTEEFAQVTIQNQPTNVHLEAFVVLAQLPELEQ